MNRIARSEWLPLNHLVLDRLRLASDERVDVVEEEVVRQRRRTHIPSGDVLRLEAVRRRSGGTALTSVGTTHRSELLLNLLLEGLREKSKDDDVTIVGSNC